MVMHGDWLLFSKNKAMLALFFSTLFFSFFSFHSEDISAAF
jgi:hypothetical protein